MERKDSRRHDRLRPVCITPDYLPHAESSALIELGGLPVPHPSSHSPSKPLQCKETGPEPCPFRTLPCPSLQAAAPQ